MEDHDHFVGISSLLPLICQLKGDSGDRYEDADVEVGEEDQNRRV